MLPFTKYALVEKKNVRWRSLYNTLMPAFFPILETLLKHAICYHQQLLFRFFFYLLDRIKTHSLHRCLQFWKEEKVSGGQVRIWPKTHAQTSFCELVRYHGAKSMIGFSTILCISDTHLYTPG